MMKKKLIPSFGWVAGQGTKDRELVDLCRFHCDNGADELLVRDLSDNDTDHERTIRLIKETARAVDIPVITGGRVKRLEDVKKYLYAGAKAVFLDVSDEENVDLIKEASSRFGTEKIYAYLPDISYINRVEEYVQLGASMLILDIPLWEEELLFKISSLTVPFFIFCHDSISMMAQWLKLPGAAGVLIEKTGEEDETAESAKNREDGTKEGQVPGETCITWKQELKKQGIPVECLESTVEWSQFKLGSDGLVPVIVQDYKTDQVLMLAYMNEDAFRHTLDTGKMTYFSRSRQKLWQKGKTSGHFQYVKSLSLDCDKDTILAKVNQIGAACHTGSRSCFFTTLAQKECRESNPLKVFEEVFAVISDRKEHPKEGSYTNYLFDKGLDKILKKLGEEATEIVIAAKNPDPEEIKYEISDFLYHMMVLMAQKGIGWEEITEELANR